MEIKWRIEVYFVGCDSNWFLKVWLYVLDVGIHDLLSIKED